MTSHIQLSAEIPDSMAGKRLDQALAELFPDYSRSRLQQWIRDGKARVDEKVLRPRDKISGGEQVVIDAELEPQETWEPQAIPLEILYEDDSLLVINKPAGMVVHPAVGNRSSTLLNALLHYAPELNTIPRAGIVHRLDKDTSGVLVVARTLTAQKKLVEQLQARTVKREYDAVVNGAMTAGGTVDAPMGRHPVKRKNMAVVESGKPAITHYRLAEKFRAHTHIKVFLETGRTHQIRVHMAHIRYPLVGDPVYGGRFRLPPAASEALLTCLQQFKRQALHAARLTLEHPASGEQMEWQAALPDDMNVLLEALRDDRDASS